MENFELGAFGSGIQTVVLVGLISFIPMILMLTTAFTRIVVVLGITRSALNTPSIPPNQVVIGLALFLTWFVMAPTFNEINSEALQPYLSGKIGSGEFLETAIEPLRQFMLAQTRETDLKMLVQLQELPQPANSDDVALSTLVPAFIISELRTAFLIGFCIYIPFLVIDFIISAVLPSIGMMMLPPVLISLPFKLLLFVAVDGWHLLVETLVLSFRA